MLTLILTNDENTLGWSRRVSSAVGSRAERVCADSASALAAMSRESFDIVMLDWDLPAGAALCFLRAMRAHPADSHVPVISTTATSNTRSSRDALKAGATGVVPRDDGFEDVVAWLLNLLTLLGANRCHGVCDDVPRPMSGGMATTAWDREMMLLLARVVEHRDNDTGDHTLRVARHSEMLARELGLSAAFTRSIRLAAPLHDIGKVAIPDQLLLKPGRLSEKEMAVVRTHAQIGEAILAGGTGELVRFAAEIAGYHHERWDGTGYPRRVSGTDIPLSARIVAVADVFDAMTSERPYKAALPIQEALDHIQAEAGRHFDPRCAEAFVKAYQTQHAFFRRRFAEAGGSSTGSQGSGRAPQEIGRFNDSERGHWTSLAGTCVRDVRAVTDVPPPVDLDPSNDGAVHASSCPRRRPVADVIEGGA